MQTDVYKSVLNKIMTMHEQYIKYNFAAPLRFPGKIALIADTDNYLYTWIAWPCLEQCLAPANKGSVVVLTG